MRVQRSYSVFVMRAVVYQRGWNLNFWLSVRDNSGCSCEAFIWAFVGSLIANLISITCTITLDELAHITMYFCFGVGITLTMLGNCACFFSLLIVCKINVFIEFLN